MVHNALFRKLQSRLKWRDDRGNGLVTERVPSVRTRINCRWQTRATRRITANMLHTNNVDAQCDKLATELSWQSFASKVANFQLPHLHLTYPTCIC